MFLDLVKSVVLGIIQGFTEFLPISSTAHLIIALKALGLNLSKNLSPEFLKSFIILIQFSSILAVVILYWKKLWSNRIIYFKKLIVAFIPTAIIGFLAYNLVKNFLQESFEIIALALFLGGIAILKFEKKYQKKIKEGAEKEENLKTDISELTYYQCFSIGFFQALAIIPGVSRSAATILGGLSIGINRLLILEFSFFLAIPTMLAASSLDLIKSNLAFNSKELSFLFLGLITSFIVAWLSIKFLLKYIRKNNFIVFAWYRIILGAALFLYLYILT